MKPLLNFALPTFQRYAEKHGYDLVVGHGAAQDRPSAWAKVPLIRGLLNTYETVFWIDSDAIILDDSADIAAEMQADDYQGLVEHRTGDQCFPNSGVWVLRGDRARQLLDAIWSETAFIEHPWWENAALGHLLGYDLYARQHRRATEWTGGTHWLDPEWNGLPAIVGLKPVRIRHYAGQPIGYRFQRIRIDRAASDRHLLGPAKIFGRTVQHAWSGQRFQDHSEADWHRMIDGYEQKVRASNEAS